MIQSACQWVSYSQENKNVAVEKLAGDYYCLDGQSWPRIYYTSINIDQWMRPTIVPTQPFLFALLHHILISQLVQCSHQHT